MDNIVHVLNGYDLYFILIFAVLELWSIQLQIDFSQCFSELYLPFCQSLRIRVILQI